MNKSQRAKQLVKYKTGMLKLDNARNSSKVKNTRDCLLQLTGGYIHHIRRMRSASARRWLYVLITRKLPSIVRSQLKYSDDELASAYRQLDRIAHICRVKTEIDFLLMCHDYVTPWGYVNGSAEDMLAAINNPDKLKFIPLANWSNVPASAKPNVFDNDVNFSYPEHHHRIANRGFPLGVASEEELAEYIKDHSINYSYPEQFPKELFTAKTLD